MNLRALLDKDGPEDAVIATLELPSWIDAVLAGMAVVVIVAGAVGSLLLHDGPDLVNFSLLALAAMPWIFWIARRRLPTPASAAVWVLGPAVVAGAVDLANGHRTLGFAPQFALYLGLLMVIGSVFASRRHATLIVGATYVMFAFRAATSQVVFTQGTWLLAVTFAVAGVVGVRVGALSVARAQQALAERDALDERRQVARDVHDVVAHTLAVTMLHITAARMAVDRSAIDDALEALEEAERHGRASLADIRGAITALRSEHETAIDAAQPDLTDIATLVAGYRAAGLPVTLTTHGDLAHAPPSVGLAVYRVTQEALANAARHGEGRTAVEVRVVDGETSLQVVNPLQSWRRPADDLGTGLAGMRERTLAAGGTFAAGRQNGNWVVSARLPCDLARLVEQP
jgi:signal transduction histidine kinase